jgi:hypothetical protein
MESTILTITLTYLSTGGFFSITVIVVKYLLTVVGSTFFPKPQFTIPATNSTSETSLRAS